MGPQGSLARQLLGWQIAIVFALLGLVAGFSVIQSGEIFRDVEGRRMLSAAEDLAATPGVRAALADPLRYHQLPAFAESARSLSGADEVIVATTDRTVLATQDPSAMGTKLPIGASTVTSGHAWIGVVDDSLVAHVPVIGDDATVIGIVAAGVDTPSSLAGILNSPGDALLLLGIATVSGIVGSLLLAWRVKRQTLGLEPAAITGLVEQREAMLHGIKEGVVGLDQHDRITLANDQARHLLSLPADCVGRSVSELALGERLSDVLTGKSAGSDQIVLRWGRVLTMNRMPISVHDRAIGSVVTLRDRTELARLQHELAAHRNATDTLRAQAHEFSNRLHTIAGLIELGEYDEVRRYVTKISHTQDRWHREVSSRIADAAVAALLIAKASLAAEHGIGLRLSHETELGEINEALSADLVTVLGNLVDNAIDASGGVRDGWIEVDVTEADDTVRVMVRDSGPGVAPEIAEEVFRDGFTTKAAQHGGQRGLGLALTRQTCIRRQGSIAVYNDGGAVFTAVLPVGTGALT